MIVSYQAAILSQSKPSYTSLFTPFKESIAEHRLPERFASPFDYEPHPLSLLAVDELQSHLRNQQEWEHNFGLNDNDGTVIGKMFGVLVVCTDENEIGYLSAFSGKLAGKNHHAGFVPPIFDTLDENGFLNSGMTELSNINQEIEKLETQQPLAFEEQVALLKAKRKTHSHALQNEIFDQYHFLNQSGETKGLRDIFEDAFYKNPPAGAGECAAPKLLQYAFQNSLKPLAMAEFWWGQSPKSAYWKHGHFYPACREKCAPILGYMLEGMELEYRNDYSETEETFANSY